MKLQSRPAKPISFALIELALQAGLPDDQSSKVTSITIRPHEMKVECMPQVIMIGQSLVSVPIVFVFPID